MRQEEFFVHQFEVGPWDNFIYFLGDKTTRSCLVVDPAWDLDVILDQAAKLDVEISGILCTHSHFDHVNMVDPLLREKDIPVYMLDKEIDWSGFRCENLKRMSPGEKLEFGKHTEITFLHTPGHTPGSTSFKVRDNLVTGDTLFINGCGRCDFVGGDPETMYYTLSDLVAKLPKDTHMYPGHNYGDVKVATLTEQLESNPYLKKATVEDFVAHRMEGKTPNSPFPKVDPEWMARVHAEQAKGAKG